MTGCNRWRRSLQLPVARTKRDALTVSGQPLCGSLPGPAGPVRVLKNELDGDADAVVGLVGGAVAPEGVHDAGELSRDGDRSDKLAAALFDQSSP